MIMRSTIAILVFACAVWGAAAAAAAAADARRRSAQADYIDELYGTEDLYARVSDNVLEDARLDVPDLIRKYNYPVEQHFVTTPDGYILEMHRIPHGRDANNRPEEGKPVAFVMHGLLSSSADWVLLGPGCALAYILAEQGFDVWMGNARGNYYSRRHRSLNPDSIRNTKFWDFSWDEIGHFDLPAMIDYTLAATGKSKLHYVGHSQGTTAFFVMASLRPEYNEKIVAMQALAPVAFMQYNKNLLFNTMAPFARNINKLASTIGVGEVLPNNNLMTWAGHSVCMDEVVFQPLCTNMLFLMAGWSEGQHNATMFPVKLGHTPAGAAVRQLAHYGQSIHENEFRRYDHGSRQNRNLYGSRTPPSYNLKRITTPVFLHYSDNDSFADTRDVRRLYEELGAAVGLFRVQLSTFSHLDFMWGIDAKTLVWDRMINLMWATEALEGNAQSIE